MSGASSEEKIFPPSQQKLKKQREKGNVVTSKETLSSVSSVVGLVYLYLRRDSIAEKLSALFTVEPDAQAEFMMQLAARARLGLDLGMIVVLPLIGIAVFVGVLAGMAVSGGPVFSVHGLIPDFNKLNPAQGFKKLFGRRAWLGFGMNLLRVTSLMLLIGVLIWQSFGGLISAPRCGMECEMSAFVALLRPILVGTIAALLLFAGLDYLVQRSAFMHEQRMTMTEFKRENKDNQGDPHLKGQMQSDRQQMLTSPTGVGQAILIIHDAPNRAIAVRYVEGETPAPLVVARARGSQAIARLIRRADVLAVHDAALVEACARIAVGDYVTDEATVMSMAPYLQRASWG